MKSTNKEKVLCTLTRSINTFNLGKHLAGTQLIRVEGRTPAYFFKYTDNMDRSVYTRIKPWKKSTGYYFKISELVKEIKDVCNYIDRDYKFIESYSYENSSFNQSRLSLIAKRESKKMFNTAHKEMKKSAKAIGATLNISRKFPYYHFEYDDPKTLESAIFFSSEMRGYMVRVASFCFLPTDKEKYIKDIEFKSNLAALLNEIIKMRHQGIYS